MNDVRKTGLLAMAIFGPAAVADFIWGAYYPNDGSGFELTFVLFVLSFAFLMGLMQFVTGERH